MEEKVGRFEDLEARPMEWRLCRPSFGGFHRVKKEGMRLAVKIYRTLNACRDYGLRDQMQRAAVSVPSNTCPVK
ncbi:MAG: four helix bundle protein [Syntrophales bacterium]|nr:four helix bundle protein [Syntrophales bacterium]